MKENDTIWRRGRPGGAPGVIRGAPVVDSALAGYDAGGGIRDAPIERARPTGSAHFCGHNGGDLDRACADLDHQPYQARACI